jgi:hypothetical protein
MLWRLSKLDWSYALGELVIVTAGVLIALAIGQWNSDRIDRIEEITILDRLLRDVQSDLGDIAFGQRLVPEKLASLYRVYSIVSNPEAEIDDPASFLEDIIDGAAYGWVQGDLGSDVFDELLSTGKFSLISDQELQSKVAEYYAQQNRELERIAERETAYPALSYQLAPRKMETSLDRELAENRLEELALNARASDLQGPVIAEINFARFVLLMFERQEQRAHELESEITAYLEVSR